jgi:hypothetical protein
MADYISKRGTSAKGNNVSECIRMCSYVLHFKINKQPKQQETSEANI